MFGSSVELGAIGLLSVALALLALSVLRASGSRRHAEQSAAFDRDLAEDLLAQTAALDRLVAALAGLADDLDESHVLERVAGEACRLVAADCAFVLERDEATGEQVVAAASKGSAGWTLPTVDVGAPGLAAQALAKAYGGHAHAVPLGAPSLSPGLLAVVRSAPGAFTPVELAQLRVLCGFATRAAQNARLFSLAETLRGEAEQRERERARLSNRLLDAEEGERRRLALALHDGPQQTIAGVGLILQAASDALADGDDHDAQRTLQLAKDQVRAIVRSLRGLSFALEPITLRDHGFDAAFCELAGQLASAHRLAIAVDASEVDRLDRQAQVCLYRIAQEALANAVKHSGARHVDVLAAPRHDGGLELVVADDGRGATAAELARGGVHRGVDAMRERAWGIGAALSFEDTVGGGTTVRVVVPPRPPLGRRALSA